MGADSTRKSTDHFVWLCSSSHNLLPSVNLCLSSVIELQEQGVANLGDIFLIFISCMESGSFSVSRSIVFSQECHNKVSVPQARWPKTIEIYCVIALEAESSKSKCQHPCSLSGLVPLSGDGPSFLIPASGVWLIILGVPWFKDTAHQSLLPPDVFLLFV